MKFVKFSILALMMSAVFFSCKKDSDSIDNTGIQGDWIGKYGFGIGTPDIYYRFKIQSGGVIEELSSSGNSKGSGTWSLNGTTFTAHYQMKAPLNAIYTLAATYNKSTKKLTGTWGYDNNATNGGLWEQTKQ
jgi:hypothetical protein